MGLATGGLKGLREMPIQIYQGSAYTRGPGLVPKTWLVSMSAVQAPIENGTHAMEQGGAGERFMKKLGPGCYEARGVKPVVQMA